MKLLQKIFQMVYVICFLIYALMVFAYGEHDMPVIFDIIGMTSTILFIGKLLYLEFKED